MHSVFLHECLYNQDFTGCSFLKISSFSFHFLYLETPLSWVFHTWEAIRRITVCSTYLFPKILFQGSPWSVLCPCCTAIVYFNHPWMTDEHFSISKFVAGLVNVAVCGHMQVSEYFSFSWSWIVSDTMSDDFGTPRLFPKCLHHSTVMPTKAGALVAPGCWWGRVHGRAGQVACQFFVTVAERGCWELGECV